MSTNKYFKLYKKNYSEELLLSLYEVCKHILMPPSTFFICCSDIENQIVFDKLKSVFPSQFVDFLLIHLKELIEKSNVVLEPEYGFEIWIGNSGKNSKTSGYLHVDNDEFLRTEYNQLKMPILGSILYLTPNDLMIGGETLFILNSKHFETALFQEYSKEYLTTLPNNKITKAKQGDFVIFDGTIPHSVLPYTIENNFNPRINLLVNMWSQRISSVPKGVTFLKLF